MNHQNRKVIVLVVDRLNPSQIGAYGNTCQPTDAIDSLASQSILFDLALSPVAGLPQGYDELFGYPSMAGVESQLPGKTWLQNLAASEIETILWSDRQWLTGGPAAAGFETARHLKVRALDRMADRISQTWLARYFAQMLGEVERLSGGSLAWFDCSGMDQQWDAPYDLRQSLADPDDPAPPEFFQKPTFVFDAVNGDPDQLLGVQQVMDAQVNLLDRFLAVLLNALEQPEFDSTMLCLTSLRGFPLGQHGSVGGLPAADSLASDDGQDQSLIDTSLRFCAGYNESLQVPLLVKFPPALGDYQAVRSGRMVSPAMILQWAEAFLGGHDDWLAGQIAVETSLPDVGRSVTVFDFGDEIGLQTHAWKLLRDRRTNHCELYAKPDDVWEVNDVSQRCPQEVRQLQELLDRLLDDPAFLHDPEFRTDF